jgi:hypothetical protein
LNAGIAAVAIVSVLPRWRTRAIPVSRDQMPRSARATDGDSADTTDTPAICAIPALKIIGECRSQFLVQTFGPNTCSVTSAELGC